MRDKERVFQFYIITFNIFSPHPPGKNNTPIQVSSGHQCRVLFVKEAIF